MSHGKRILMLTHEFPPINGGVARYASEMAGAACELGYDVDVVAPDCGGNGALSDLPALPYRVIRFPGHIYSARQLIPVLWRTLRLAGPREYDILHTVDWPHLVAMAFINHFVYRPFVATVYGTELLGVPESRHARWLGLKELFSAPASVFAISQFTRELLLTKCPYVDADKIAVTPLGTNPFWFEHVPDVGGIRRRLRIPDRHKIILTVARLDERKGHRSVLRALQTIDSDLKREVTYVIVGQPGSQAYFEEIKLLAARVGVPVLFATDLTDTQVRALYATSYLFCMPGEPHPRKVEGFGLVYLEAAAQGLPSIASHIGAVAEVVRHDVTGILTAPEDIVALAGHLMRMLKNPAEQQRLGCAAKHWAREFTWRRCAAQTYEGIL